MGTPPAPQPGFPVTTRVGLPSFPLTLRFPLNMPGVPAVFQAPRLTKIGDTQFLPMKRGVVVVETSWGGAGNKRSTGALGGHCQAGLSANTAVHVRRWALGSLRASSPVALALGLCGVSSASWASVSCTVNQHLSCHGAGLSEMTPRELL